MVRRLLPAELTGMSVLDAGCAPAHMPSGCCHGPGDRSRPQFAMVRAAQARLGAGRCSSVIWTRAAFVDEVFDGVLCSLSCTTWPTWHRAEGVSQGAAPRRMAPLTLDHPANFEDRRDDYFATA